MQDVSIILTALLTSSTFFFLLYLSLYRKLSIPYHIRQISNPKEQKQAFWEYIANYVSIIHAISALLMGVYNTMSHGVQLFNPNTYQENLIVAFSLGYFTTDTIIGLIGGFNDSTMIFHHVECILSLWYTLLKGNYACVIIWALTLAELSNPFILARKNIQKHRGYELIADIIGIVFSVLFLVSRSYFIGITMMPLLGSEVSLVLKLHSGLLWYVSLYWCNTILNLLTKALYETTNFWLIGELYKGLRKFRKNVNCQVCFHVCIGALCFMRTFVSWNHKEIF